MSGPGQHAPRRAARRARRTRRPPRGRRRRRRAPGARGRAAAASPRTRARSPRDRRAASRPRTRCRSGTRSARRAGRRPSRRPSGPVARHADEGSRSRPPPRHHAVPPVQVLPHRDRLEARRARRAFDDHRRRALLDLDDHEPAGARATRPPARTAARRARSRRTRRARGRPAPRPAASRARRAGTYGGLQTTRSIRPRSSAGIGRADRPRRPSTPAPARRAFSRARSTASGDRSVANTRGARVLVGDRERDRAGPRATSTTDGAATPAIAVERDSTRTSVSGRGTNTPGRTRERRACRNPCSPVRCCSGVPVHRRQSARPKRAPRRRQPVSRA